jgi:hypothetical protein
VLTCYGVFSGLNRTTRNRNNVMGACDFQSIGRGENAAQAFRQAHDAACHDHGNSGYTGTIAEKSGYRLINPNAGETPEDCIRRCQADMDHFSQDKWGDAGAVMLSVGVYCFFGMASS